jgi:hypothetical protein
MDKDILLKRKAVDRVETVDLGDGAFVTVRALSKGEIKAVREENASAHTYENRLISTALVDPVMTPVEVDEWLTDAPAGDYVSIEQAVMRLSGLGDDAQKSGLAGVSDES